MTATVTTIITTTRDLHRYLEARDWSTTAPTKDDSWEATAWPPLRRDGQPTAHAMRLHNRLARLGLLGPLRTDSEGAPCARVHDVPPCTLTPAGQKALAAKIRRRAKAGCRPEAWFEEAELEHQGRGDGDAEIEISASMSRTGCPVTIDLDRRWFAPRYAR